MKPSANFITQQSQEKYAGSTGKLGTVSSIYIWSKNFSHSSIKKVKPNMADIQVKLTYYSF